VNFDWTEEQQAWRDAVLAFAQRELTEGDAPRAPGGFPAEAWRRCASFGIQGLPVPEEHGGGAAGAAMSVLALEALGQAGADNGLVFSLGAQMAACEVPIVRFGTDEQRRRYLPGLCHGSLVGAQAVTEPEAGSDAFALATSATPTAGGYVLTGTKTFVTNAPEADVFLVYATTEPGSGLAGICAFLLPRDLPGLAVSGRIETMGLSTSPIGELVLDRCEVDAGALLGEPGGGMGVFSAAMLWERMLVSAPAVGAMARLLERCVAHARERRQFGQPIGRFQAVSHRIADMKVRLETSRLLLYRLAALVDAGRATPLDAALAKLQASEGYLQSSLDALQIHGAYGYAVESGLEREVRDAIGSRIYSGTSEMQRNIVAGLLGL
jgi:alkylation response protein AidB-like acyl-CoA dehydrogenase